MTRWLDIPLGRHAEWKDPTWGLLAERYDRCSRRLAFYVGQRVHDRGTLDRIVVEVLQRNLELLIAAIGEGRWWPTPNPCFPRRISPDPRIAAPRRLGDPGATSRVAIDDAVRVSRDDQPPGERP